jgi:hypothetical protein
MNPWSMERLAHEHQAFLLRAAHPPVPGGWSSRRREDRAQAHHARALRYVGVLLIRAGSRLAGPNPSGDVRAPVSLARAAGGTPRPC